MEGCKFSGGTAKANLILSTGILQRAWTSISELQQSGNRHLPFIVNDRFRSFTIVAFHDLQNQTQDLHLLPPFLAPLQPTHPDFGFLVTKDNPSISLHASPLSIFLRLLRTTDLKAQLQRSTEKNKPQLILVGRSIGGSVAALCTLWLLKNQSSPSLPLCITFGSPLIGDDGLRKAIGAVEQWKAQFWHVAGHDDIIPRLFASRPVGQNSCSQCKAFGTYFLISDSGCTCVDDPESVLELLDLISPSLDDELPMQLRPKNYGVLLKQLEKKPLCRSRNIQAARFQESLTVDMALQLDSVGIGSNHLKHKSLLQSMEGREKKVYLKQKSTPNPSKRLNEVKKQMARLEWYKKECESKNTTYYDCYKSRSTEKDIDVIKFKNILNNYWKEKVEEAENKPQLPQARMRVKWLFGGVTYKRMVEPLDIADHYRRSGRGDYMAKRPRHYELLDKWHEEDDKKHNAAKKKKKEKGTSLTDDSCFWAHVEDAARRLNELKKEGRIAGGKSKEDLWNELREFEGFVMKSVNNYELSPEVFLENSSFMEWWKEYEKEMEPGYSSQFVAFMKDRGYVNYK